MCKNVASLKTGFIIYIKPHVLFFFFWTFNSKYVYRILYTIICLKYTLCTEKFLTTNHTHTQQNKRNLSSFKLLYYGKTMRCWIVLLVYIFEHIIFCNLTIIDYIFLFFNFKVTKESFKAFWNNLLNKFLYLLLFYIYVRKEEGPIEKLYKY